MKRRSILKISALTGALLIAKPLKKISKDPKKTTTIRTDSSHIIVNNWYLKPEDIS